MAVSIASGAIGSLQYDPPTRALLTDLNRAVRVSPVGASTSGSGENMCMAFAMPGKGGERSNLDAAGVGRGVMDVLPRLRAVIAPNRCSQ